MIVMAGHEIGDCEMAAVGVMNSLEVASTGEHLSPQNNGAAGTGSSILQLAPLERILQPHPFAGRSARLQDPLANLITFDPALSQVLSPLPPPSCGCTKSNAIVNHSTSFPAPRRTLTAVLTHKKFNQEPA